MSATKSQALDLIVSVKGEIQKSNFDEFKAMAEQRISALNFEPSTDEEFGQAEEDVKGLAKFEKDLSKAEEDVLKQMDEVYHLVSGIGELKKLSAESRLKLKRQIDQQKKVVRLQIKRAAISAIPIAHPQAEARIEAAMKGKRTLASLEAAARIESELIQKEIAAAQEVVNSFRDRHGDDITHDEHKLLIMEAAFVEAELSRRVERKAAMMREAELKAQAEQARREAEQAQAETRPEQPEVEQVEQSRSIPDPEPKSPPQPAQGQSEAEELAEFLDAIRASFAPIKEARAALKHEENIFAAGKFAVDVKAAFSRLKGGNQ